MRHPLSIYVRSTQRTLSRFVERAGRRVKRVISVADEESLTSRHGAHRSLVDAASIKAALDTLGIVTGDTIMVHSGISNLGKVVGGPRVIFDLVRDQVGPSGHVLFPVFPFATLMAEYLKSGPTFDVRTAPSKMGALTEFALKCPSGMRSVHPTHSVIAFGPRSAEFVKDHHLCQTPFANESPFGKLVDFNGKILIIGVGLNSTTSFHRTEDRLGSEFPVKVYLSQPFRTKCLDADGVQLEVSTFAHDPFISRIRDCNLARIKFLQSGVLKEIAVGDGVVGIVDARGMDQHLEEMMRSHKETIYGKIWG